MKIAGNFHAATAFARNSEPFFYTHFTAPLYAEIHNQDFDRYVIGRQYRGLFGEEDGSYVTLTKTKGGDAVIDRDCYGAIPLFYSVGQCAISTDLRLLVRLCSSDFNYE